MNGEKLPVYQGNCVKSSVDEPVIVVLKKCQPFIGGEDQEPVSIPAVVPKKRITSFRGGVLLRQRVWKICKGCRNRQNITCSPPLSPHIPTHCTKQWELSGNRIGNTLQRISKDLLGTILRTRRLFTYFGYHFVFFVFGGIRSVGVR